MFYNELFYKKILLNDSDKSSFVYSALGSDFQIMGLTLSAQGKKAEKKGDFFSSLGHLFSLCYYYGPEVIMNAESKESFSTSHPFLQGATNHVNFSRMVANMAYVPMFKLNYNALKITNKKAMNEFFSDCCEPMKKFTLPVRRDRFFRHNGAYLLLVACLEHYSKSILKAVDAILNSDVMPNEMMHFLFEPLISFFAYRTVNEKWLEIPNAYFDLIINQVRTLNKENNIYFVKQIDNLIINLDYFFSELFDGSCEKQYKDFYKKVKNFRSLIKVKKVECL